MSLPYSAISICKNVKLDRTYQHTIHFNDRVDQMNYFASHLDTTYSDYTYLRKNNSVQVGAYYLRAKKWNYLYTENYSDDMIYFYFITDVKYINESTVELELELDVMQTYGQYYTLLPSFVVREHCATDEPGEHTLDEGLELGQLINAGTDTVTELEDLCLMVMSSIDIDKSLRIASSGGDQAVRGSGFNWEGVYSGLAITAVEPADYTKFDTDLATIDTKGWSEGILTMWAYPKPLLKIMSSATYDSTVAKTVYGTNQITKTIKPYTAYGGGLFGGYQPIRNKKLFTYPYNFLYISNNAGGCAEYRWELFKYPENISFSLMGGLSPDATVICAPDNYKGTQVNFEEAISLGNFPTCAWSSDPYKIWLAQNQNTQNVQLQQLRYNTTMGAIGAVASAVTLDFGGAVSNANSAVDAQYKQQAIMAQRRDMDVQPHQAKGNHSVSTNIFWDKQNFSIYYRTITREYAEAIDHYFDLYGYQVNTVKVPSTKNRQNWTYVKTSGCNLTGDIPQTDLAKIKAIFDKGITFWVNGDNIGNYELSNNCLRGDEQW